MGCGWQSYVAYVNLGCYYLIGVPLGIFMGWIFHKGVMVTFFCIFYIWSYIIRTNMWYKKNKTQLGNLGWHDCWDSDSNLDFGRHYYSMWLGKRGRDFFYVFYRDYFLKITKLIVLISFCYFVIYIYFFLYTAETIYVCVSYRQRKQVCTWWSGTTKSKNINLYRLIWSWWISP